MTPATGHVGVHECPACDDREATLGALVTVAVDLDEIVGEEAEGHGADFTQGWNMCRLVVQKKMAAELEKER